MVQTLKFLRKEVFVLKGERGATPLLPITHVNVFTPFMDMINLTNKNTGDPLFPAIFNFPEIKNVFQRLPGNR